MAGNKRLEVLLNKYGKWGPIIVGTWVGLHIVIPIAILRVPAIQKYLVALESQLPFNIPGVG